MMEVVFSNGAAGGLRYARHCSGWDPDGGSRDVICFGDDLSLGDISGDCLSQARRDSLLELFSLFSQELSHILRRQEEMEHALEKLLRRAAAGEPIRIWYSHQPDEWCGFCWLLTELTDRLEVLPPITGICLPERVERGPVTVAYFGWREVCPEEFSGFLPLEEPIGAELPEIRRLWHRLQGEHATLRAKVEGQLQSVAADYYDFAIEEELAAAPRLFHEASLIGQVLGRHSLGIGDLWVALRLEEKLRRGELIAATQPEEDDLIYRRWLKKA